MSRRATTLFRFWYFYSQEMVLCGWASADQFQTRLDALMKVTDPDRLEMLVARLSREALSWAADLRPKDRRRLAAAAVCRGGAWIEDVELLLKEHEPPQTESADT